MIGMKSETRSRSELDRGPVDRGHIFANVSPYLSVCPVFGIAQCFFVIETIRSYLCLPVLCVRFTLNRIPRQR